MRISLVFPVAPTVTNHILLFLPASDGCLFPHRMMTHRHESEKARTRAVFHNLTDTVLNYENTAHFYMSSHGLSHHAGSTSGLPLL